MFDIITVGDALVDVLLSLEPNASLCRIDHEHHELCFQIGAKMMVKEADFYLGGNASNVAVGLSRMGNHVALIAEIGDDELAQKIINGLGKERIDLSHVKQHPQAQSSFSVVLNMGGDRTLFSRHVVRDHKIAIDDIQTKWIYLTSLGKEWKVMYQHVVDYVKKTGAKVAFNPGSQQLRDGAESFADVLGVTDILFINREEAEVILHGSPKPKEEKETPENLLFRLQRTGAKVICMTDGPAGAYLMTEDAKLLHQEAIETVLLGKTGAGDAFSAGFMAGVLGEKTMEEALLWGAINSSHVLQHTGAQTGLLTKEQLEEKITQV